VDSRLVSEAQGAARKVCRAWPHAVSAVVPDVQANRINLDAVLVFGGRLTAAVFDDLQAEAVDLLQVKAMSLEQQI